MQPLFLAETCNVPREKIRYIRLFASRGMSSICAKEMSAPLFFFQKALGELVDIDKPKQNTYLAQNIYSGVAKPIIKPRRRNTGKRRMLVGSQIAVLPHITASMLSMGKLARNRGTQHQTTKCIAKKGIKLFFSKFFIPTKTPKYKIWNGLFLLYRTCFVKPEPHIFNRYINTYAKSVCA